MRTINASTFKGLDNLEILLISKCVNLKGIRARAFEGLGKLLKLLLTSNTQLRLLFDMRRKLLNTTQKSARSHLRSAVVVAVISAPCVCFIFCAVCEGRQRSLPGQPHWAVQNMKNAQGVPGPAELIDWTE